MQQVHMSSRLSPNSSISPSNSVEHEDEIDVLVLVGTIERPPRGYIRFEHEEILEEKCRLESFRNHKHTHLFNARKEGKVEMAVSASADTIRASGGEKGILFAPSSDNFSSGQAIGHSFSSGEDLTGLGHTSSAIGLDLSSSRGGNTLCSTPWGSVTGVESIKNQIFQPPIAEMSVPRDIPESTAPEIKTSSSPSNYKPKASRLDYEFDSEPIHIVRTVHPEEHPLQVRDQMTKTLVQLRRDAEDEMGLRLHLNDEEKSDSLLGQQLSSPTFRWFFQPCSALGSNGSYVISSKIQSIPAYIDFDGYCTGCGESDSDHSDSENSNFGDVESKADEHLSSVLKRLAKERRHIAMLRDLNDPTFVISGYLQEQSHRDPNVWRRVYCVLSGDRLWTIRRMKTLTTNLQDQALTSNLLGNDDALASLRLGRHSYIELHRSLLLESGEGAEPLGRRLPNTFRIIPFSGHYHTFRAFNATSFRIWTSSLAEKITLKHCDGLMELANVIAEDEVSARCKRLDDVAISPLLDKMTLDGNLLATQNSGSNTTLHSRVPELLALSADVTKFGFFVAEFKEMCRLIANVIQQDRQGVHLQVKSLTASQETKYHENISMVNVVWEDARVVASKSAQLIHNIAARQHNDDTNSQECENLTERLLNEQKALQTRLGRRWDSIRTSPHQMTGESTTSEESNNLMLPPLNLFDSLLDLFQSVCAALHFRR
jgi:hypothetical protein